MDLNHPDVVAEVQALFERYERALVTSDVATLDRLFWQSASTVRYGATETLYGFEEIASFRRARSPLNLDRTLRRVVVSTFGKDFAIVSAEFDRPLGPRIRQSQTWVRLSEGWRIVAAHISAAPEPTPA